jgi:chromosomal replication initiator protein
MDTWDYSVFWDEAINQAKAELGEHEFAMWFNIQYDSSSESSISIRVPSTFYKDQFVRQYQKYLEDKLYDLMGRRIGINFMVVKPTKTEGETPSAPATSNAKARSGTTKEKESPGRDKGKHPQLRTDYTFENFVIGDNNGFASNAALAIAKNPGTSYNPFLI